MMNKRAKFTGKCKTAQYFAVPYYISKNERYRLLSSKAVKLFLDIGAQYNGYNNGQIMAT